MSTIEVKDGFGPLNQFLPELRAAGLAKYDFSPFVPQIDRSDRRWAGRENRITAENMPTLCEVGLRDGNQSLRVPMTVEQKLAYFDLLQRMGFKEIEVGYPAASEADREFIRRLVDEKRINADVKIQVLCATRSDLLDKTFEAVKDVPNVIIHIYNSTSEAQRKYVFSKPGESDDQVKQKVVGLAVEATKKVKTFEAQAAERGQKVWLQYSPESFSGTEPIFALEVVSAVIKEWQPRSDRKMILNLPATVEMTTPDEFADYVQWMIDKIPSRESVIVSIHTHNDRGSAVAATELAVKAGADRVEGTLFGNGERTGNMDMVTFCGNRYVDGVDPKIDMSLVYEAKQIYQQTTGMVVPERQPYAGDLVNTAFSGSHQDAIRKGLAQGQALATRWDVPYVPFCPADLGIPRYDFIQVNGQSGKGGVQYVLESSYGIRIPRALEAEFGAVIKEYTDRTGNAVEPQKIREIFMKTFAEVPEAFQLTECKVNDTQGGQHAVTIRLDGDTEVLQGIAVGPVSAANAALRSRFGEGRTVESYESSSVGKGDNAQAITFICVKDANTGRHAWGVGFSSSINESAIKALIAAQVRVNVQNQVVTDSGARAAIA